MNLAVSGTNNEDVNVMDAGTIVSSSSTGEIMVISLGTPAQLAMTAGSIRIAADESDNTKYIVYHDDDMTRYDTMEEVKEELEYLNDDKDDEDEEEPIIVYKVEKIDVNELIIIHSDDIKKAQKKNGNQSIKFQRVE